MLLTKRLSLLLLATAVALPSCSKKDRSAAGTEKSAAAGSGDRVIIQNKGSDTLVNVAQAWAEGYKKVNTKIAVAVSGGGTGTGISAMINGTVDLANASREMKDSEKQAATAKGHPPVEHVVGYDALAVYLHKGNPLKEITLAQLADIYAEDGKAEKWSQLGIKVPGCESDEIIRISRQNNSGTYAYFKEIALSKKEYKLGSRDMHGSKDVVDLVAKTPCAIGYSGLAYATPEVGMPCVKKEDGGACVIPSVKTAMDRTYPIARALYMYTAGEPKGAIKEYLDWIKGKDGQCIIAKKGYAPATDVTCD